MSTTQKKSKISIWFAGDNNVRQHVLDADSGESLADIYEELRWGGFDVSTYKYVYSLRSNGDLKKPLMHMSKRCSKDLLFSSLPGLCPEQTSRPIGGIGVEKWMSRTLTHESTGSNLKLSKVVAKKIEKI